MSALIDFAKTYQTSAGQVLVFVTENDNRPAICLAAMCADSRNVKMHIGGWENTEAGWSKAFDALGMFDADAAENFVSKVLPEIAP